MPDDNYDDIISAAAPTRTSKGALKYQPPDTDWSLDKLPELQSYYQTTYKRALPITVKGQGSIHNKWGYDHRGSADVSLDPSTDEGQQLITELQRRNIPFLAFDHAIPGVASGPHIHLGRPSHHTDAKFNVGAQVKGAPKPAAAPTPDDYTDVIAVATGSPATPAPKSTGPLKSTTAHQGVKFGQTGIPAQEVRRGIATAERIPDTIVREGIDTAEKAATGSSNIGELRRIDQAALAEQRDTGVGHLRQLDEPQLAERRQVEAEVRRERGFKSALGMPQTNNPIAAISDFIAGRTEDDIVRAEVDARMQGSYAERQRIREITQQFTDEDRTQLNAALTRMRGQGPVNRGIETGSQRVGSSLLYKLAGLADIVDTATGGFIANRGPRRSALGDYLRRQAGRGELAIDQIEAEAPPEIRQQLADFVTHAVGSLPEIYGATLAAGPVGGFAALGGLEATGQKRPFSTVAKETAKGATLGVVFKGAGAIEGPPAATLGQRTVQTAESAAAIGLGTYATEKAFGADDHDALRSAASNVLFHVGMKVPGEIGRLTTAAEKALTTPDETAPTPTVSPDLQERLSRAEEAATSPAPTPAPPADMTGPPPLPAKPAADVAAINPAAPSRLVEVKGKEYRQDELGDWYDSNGRKVTEPEVLRAIEVEQSLPLVEPAEPTAKPSLADALRTRAEAGPTEPAKPAELEDLGEVDVGPTDAGPTKAQLDKIKKRREGGEGGYIDLNEIREGVRAGKLKVEEAVDQLRERFRNASEDKLRVIARRERDPLIGIVDDNGAIALDNPYRAMTHSIAFRESLKRNPNANHWRYEPVNEAVYWNDVPTDTERAHVLDYLGKRGLKVDASVGFDRYDSRKLWEDEAAQLNQPHHSTVQPRTPTGQFAPGEPGGLEAARSQLRSEARKYAGDYKRLDLHQARRVGLDIINDDVAHNYFAQLHRMAAEFKPEMAEAVDRAETLYNQGKYSQATMLAESVFGSLPDKVNEYAGADAAIQLLDRGLTPKANWSKVLQEVRERMKRTGPLSGGGSTFYDVNKYPEGGRPDHSKIAYILEPVIDAIRSDAQRLIAEGKLKATDYVDHIRTQVNKMLQGPEFTDWHPLNKSAAMGVLVDRLRKEGPPPVQPTEPAQPSERQRSLPKTLETSGRDPGTNLTYDRLPNAAVNERVEARLAAEGADALEKWYRSAPESADRTAAHRVLVDHYTAEAARLAETAPQTAMGLLLHARELSNLEVERATSLGQAVQMYSNLLRYTPTGVMRELASLAKKGAEITPETTRRLTEMAHEHERLDKQVKGLEKRLVEAEGNEEPEPVEVAQAVTSTNAASRRAQRAKGSAGPTEPQATEGAPRRYRPRTDAPDTPAERIRRQLDEAAKRRRAAKAAIAAQLKAIADSRTVSGYWKRSMNLTRGLMVSAFTTAMRNLETQALRFDIERLDDVVEHTLRRSVGLDSDLSYRNILRNTARQFKASQTTEAREILQAHEGEYRRMFNNYAGGVEVPIPTPAKAALERTFQTVEKGVEIANIFNRIQEFHLRSAEFLAELDLHLRKEHNQTLEQFTRRNGIDAVPLDLIRKGVDKALEVTFADMPLRDGAGGNFLNAAIRIGNYLPPTLSPVAFPRFMFNNLKFLYQHSPAGMLDLARKSQNRPRVISRALVGASLLLLAYQFRNSDHAGEKWYELKLGGHTLDARPFGPFSTYLFLAEAIRRAKEGEKQFTLEEVTGAIGASSGPGGTAISVAERLYNYITDEKWDKAQRLIKTEAGEWGRALLTPVRQVKDFIGAFDASQAVSRDISTEPFLGAIKESIPYASTDLPEAHLPTTATPIHQEHPALKGLTGWRVETPKTFLQRQLDELNFTSSEIRSNTGNPEIDNLEKRLMGPLMDQLSAELENDAEYKSLSKKGRAAYLKDMLKDIREEVRDAAEEERPDLYEQHREERKPRRQREYEQELNSPGLSRALQLGVPMPIPHRNPGEDDIAYRARLLQLGRQRRSQLDAVVGQLGNLTPGQQRSRLHSALYRG